MSATWKFRLAAVGNVLLAVSAVMAQAVPAELKTKVEARAKLLHNLSKDPAVVNAVKAYNASPPAEARAMTNEKWKSLTLLDPFVRSHSRNPLGVYLKARQTEEITECFVSAADGTKVAFLSKTTSWSHKGKAKHDVPMTGSVWYGPVEVDESTGQQQVQVGLPVLDGAKPIGSIVVGLSVAKLR